MSITLTRQETYDCALAECDATRTRTSSVAGSFCSEKCAARDRGRKLLGNLKHDRRWCWSCFRQRVEIERPTAAARRHLDGPIIDDALVGFEYGTEYVDRGAHGIECTCGAVDHDLDADWVRDSGPYHWYLIRAIEQTAAEGQHDDSVDIEVLADALWQTDDLELAVGLALRT